MKGLFPNQVQALVDCLASHRNRCLQLARRDREAGHSDYAEYWEGRASTSDFALQEIRSLLEADKERDP